MDQEVILRYAEAAYSLSGFPHRRVEAHEGGRNVIYIYERPNGRKQVLRFSLLNDRTEDEYLAETEFIRYLAVNGAPVADVIPSIHQKLAEQMEIDGETVYISLFEYAEGMLISDNGYRYREGALLEEYFYNTGKTLGIIHRLSKAYNPQHQREDYFKKYDPVYIDRLIPDIWKDLKTAIFHRLEQFRSLPTDHAHYRLIHFDFSDGNYHIDIRNGRITVFDFDNCLNAWYMFDLANLWTHGEGWCRGIPSGKDQLAYMKDYFDTILAGYRTETDISDDMLDKLPLFIDMVLIENIVDEFECCAREGELPEDEDIEDAAECLINGIPYAGIGMVD